MNSSWDHQFLTNYHRAPDPERVPASLEQFVKSDVFAGQPSALYGYALLARRHPALVHQYRAMEGVTAVREHSLSLPYLTSRPFMQQLVALAGANLSIEALRAQ